MARALEIDLPDLTGRAPEAYVRQELQHAIGTLYIWGKKGGKSGKDARQPIQPSDYEPLQKRHRQFINWLELNDTILPSRIIKTITSTFGRVYNEEEPETWKVYLEQDLRERAKALVEHWEKLGMGDEKIIADAGSEGGVDGPASDVDDAVHGAAGPPLLTTTGADIHFPPENHPVFGPGRPLDGIAFKQGRRTPCINVRRARQKKSFAVFGHNNLTPGQWWPLQLSALFHGAHGAAQGGISGHRDLGAYSIVVTPSYEGLDEDHGDVIYYSASGAHKNDNPEQLGDAGPKTELLRKSMARTKPVRVLRGAGSSSRWAPYRGIRYDGLYQVVGIEKAKNAKGGLYERFRLQRLGGQPSLEKIVQRTPRAMQEKIYQQYKTGY